MSFSGATSPGKIPCPHATIGCQELLATSDVSYSGTLLKPAVNQKRMSFIASLMEKIPWSNRYVILSKGSVYLYRDSLAKKPSSAYSLYGYHQVVRAGDIAVKRYPWTFKIVNLANPEHCKYFAAGSEREMKIWLKEIRSQLIVANADLLSIAKVNARLILEDDDVEKSIYGDSAQSVTSFSTGFTRSSTNSISSDYPEDSDDSSDYDKIDDSEFPRPLPPVPDENSNTTPASAPFKAQHRPPPTPPSELAPKLPSTPAPVPMERNKRSTPTTVHSPPPVKPKPLLEKPVASFGKPPTENVSNIKKKELPRPPERNELFKMSEVYWDGSDKHAADQIIRNIGKDGVFMVRESDNPLCVKTLVCFADGRPVKFMIKQDPSGKYYIHEEWTFVSIPALLEHYHHNNLPKKLTTLTEPHTRYTKD